MCIHVYVYNICAYDQFLCVVLQRALELALHWRHVGSQFWTHTPAQQIWKSAKSSAQSSPQVSLFPWPSSLGQPYQKTKVKKRSEDRPGSEIMLFYYLFRKQQIKQTVVKTLSCINHPAISAIVAVWTASKHKAGPREDQCASSGSWIPFSWHKVDLIESQGETYLSPYDPSYSLLCSPSETAKALSILSKLW